MTKKLALLGSLCTLVLFLGTACSTTKSSATTDTSSNDAKATTAQQTNQDQPAPVAQGPAARAWGSTISPNIN